MDIKNVTRTRTFVVPLLKNWVENWGEGEPADEFLHVLQDALSHDEVYPQP